MYKLLFQSAVKKDIKNLDKKLQKILKEDIFPQIEKDPYNSFELQYNFSGLRSYHFSYKGTQYRVIYEIYENEKEVVIIMVGSREKFYEVLKRRV